MLFDSRLIGISPKDNQEYVEYYLPNGTVKVFWKGDLYQAKWAISEYFWCVDYETDPRACCMFSLEGDVVTWYGAGGKVVKTAKLLKGNAKGL